MRWFLSLMLAVTTHAFAQSGASLRDALRPKTEALMSACEKAIQTASDSKLAATERENRERAETTGTQTSLRFSPEAYVTWPLYSAYQTCRVATERLEAPPLSFLSSPFVVYIQGRVNQLRDSSNFRVALVFLDAAGLELQRFTPTSQVVGESAWWNVSCTTTPCQWSGTNAYSFNPDRLPGFDAILAKTKTMRVLISRGSGIEQYDLTSTEFVEYF